MSTDADRYRSMWESASERYRGVVDAVFQRLAAGDVLGLLEDVGNSANSCDYVAAETIALFDRAKALWSTQSGVDMIAAERQRQIDVEGWTAEHDDETGRFFELSQAAKTYISEAQRVGRGIPGGTNLNGINTHWPWTSDWWKPSDDPIRNLVKAGALIAAEIDRLERSR